MVGFELFCHKEKFCISLVFAVRVSKYDERSQMILSIFQLQKNEHEYARMKRNTTNAISQMYIRIRR